MDINHLSVSRKKTFDQCSQLYKFKYHLKTPSPQPEPFYFVYGNLVHKIAELYVAQKGSKEIDKIALDVMRGKIELKDGKKCPKLPKEYQNKIGKDIKAIKNLTKKIGFDGYVEYDFTYDLDPPNKKNVIGFIDRLIIKEDSKQKKAFIIDYKTTKKGKHRLNNETVLYDLQLRCYCRMVQRIFDIPASNIKAALFYLDGENLIAAQYNQDSLERVEKELKNGYVTIEETKAETVRGSVGWHCKNCEYSSICQFYKSQNQSNESWNGDLLELGHNNFWN